MSRKKPVEEARICARSLAVFYGDITLEVLLVQAFLSGYKMCEVKNDLKPDKSKGHVGAETLMFDWTAESKQYG